MSVNLRPGTVRAWLATVAFCSIIAAPDVLALGPHEIVVLVNTNSDRSVRVAQEFVTLRSVPDANVVELSLPDHANGKPDAAVHPTGHGGEALFRVVA